LIPVTVIKTRFESGIYTYNGVIQALGNLHKTEGLRGLTSGLFPTLLRDVPYSGLYLMFYSQLKSNAKLILNQTESKEFQNKDQKETKNKKTTSSSLVNFGASIVAGILASLVTHPFDVIKTKVQVSKPPLKSGFVFMEIVKTDGFRGLFIGLLPRLLRRSLMTALSWTLYESIFEYIVIQIDFSTKFQLYFFSKQ